MPNQPTQLPNIDLPGAEYLSLAPNATLALGGRRRVFNRVAPVSVPATTAINITNNVVLENPITPTSGIFLHYFFLAFLGLGPGIGLQLNSSQAGLSFEVTGFSCDYPLGNPVLTQPTPDISVITLTDRDRLIACKDIINVGTGPENRSILQLATIMAVNNPTSGAINATSAAVIIYTRLDGLTE